jgi:TatD DNase family protein
MIRYELVDAHCHLDMHDFDADRSAVIERAQAAGIGTIVVPGVSSDTWKNVLAVCREQYCYPCYGLHPYHADKHEEHDLDVLKLWLTDHPAVAVGECGLDYRKGQADREKQRFFFESQLSIAMQFDLPVVIHSVHATEDVIRALKPHRGIRGMVHSFSGSYEQALQLIEMGIYISLGGPVTYDRATRLRETAARLPLESLLIETDAPDQPDAGHHGERNEPAYIVNVLQCLAELREEDAESIARRTTANARQLFGIAGGTEASP